MLHIVRGTFDGEASGAAVPLAHATFPGRTEKSLAAISRAAANELLFLLFLFFLLLLRGPANGQMEILLLTDAFMHLLYAVHHEIHLLQLGRVSHSRACVVRNIQLIVEHIELIFLFLEIVDVGLNRMDELCDIAAAFLVFGRILQGRQIGLFAIDENLLAMLEVGVAQIRFGADFMEGGIVVVDTTVKAMSIFMSGQEVLFNAFGARGCMAELAAGLLSDNGGVAVTADGAYIGFYDHVFQGFGRHGG